MAAWGANFPAYGQYYDPNYQAYYTAYSQLGAPTTSFPVNGSLKPPLPGESAPPLPPGVDGTQQTSQDLRPKSEIPSAPHAATPTSYNPYDPAYAAYYHHQQQQAHHFYYQQQQQQAAAYAGWPSYAPSPHGAYPIAPPQQVSQPLSSLTATQPTPPQTAAAPPKAQGMSFSIKPQGPSAVKKTAVIAKPVSGVAFSTPASTGSGPSYIKVGTTPTSSAPLQAVAKPQHQTIIHQNSAFQSPVVNVRPTSAATASAPIQQRFPPTFQPWVERCFLPCRTNADRQVMTALLTAKIKEVEKMKRTWLVDWDKEALLQLPSTTQTTIATSVPTTKLGSMSSSMASRLSSSTKDMNGGGSYSKRSRRDRSEDYDQDDDDHDDDDSRGRRRCSSSTSESSDSDSQNVRRQQQKGSKGRGKVDHASAASRKLLSKKQRKLMDAQLAAAGKVLDLDHGKLSSRAGRFGDGRAIGGVQSWGKQQPQGGVMNGRKVSDWRNKRYNQEEEDSDMDVDLSLVAIVGSSQVLEKSYFRLTAAPDPSSVRPEPVLRRALSRLVGMLKEGSANWFYACDQFKGMRQDCTVQHLRNSVAVLVYEAHGRAALEYGDLAEFNQCQTQLHAMYADHQPGCVAEFTAYKMLYETVYSHRSGVSRSLLHTLRTALSSSSAASEKRLNPGSVATAPQLQGKTPQSEVVVEDALSATSEVKHAMAVRRAVMTADYLSFFKLYQQAPHLGRALMDGVAHKMRWAALNVIVKAFKAAVPVSFLASVLGFTQVQVALSDPQQAGSNACSASTLQSKSMDNIILPGCRTVKFLGKNAAASSLEEGLKECGEWLVAHGAVVEESKGVTEGEAHRTVVEESKRVAEGEAHGVVVEESKIVAEGEAHGVVVEESKGVAEGEAHGVVVEESKRVAEGETHGVVAEESKGVTEGEAHGVVVEESKGVAECEAHGVVVEESKGVAECEVELMLDVKASVGSLFIPEEPKVSHGDDNLSLGDFLSAAAKAAASVQQAR
ncbi:hypothetical protein CEUSTIGMA_g6461.t1 [Chlamydomonas eustigma]|uniref:SAC3/GANP/THP3 conserved domain-containing protein n=1 Tax=Chlamydomonas eustigma TaxID=1157962 RepID=A0A250X7F5_9CHLO|nr:hypothetical protein CEUSTIGMA_g6461.t1 [Chlamydomonas eustigma]|eukprot:GAX79021.1 hypothetical protein CEUSTIGMA_g6461.t1 [Chlamydomonas eustigma]